MHIVAHMIFAMLVWWHLFKLFYFSMYMLLLPL